MGNECDWNTLCEILKELIKTLLGAGEMTQSIRACVALSEEWAQFPASVTSHKHL